MSIAAEEDCIQLLSNLGISASKKKALVKVVKK